jgi:3-deoxy-D-manno-octulosonic-acid transferase
MPTGSSMGLLLDFAYLLACVVLSPWLLYRLVLGPDRRDFAMRFGLGLGEPLDGCIWLHGSSAGEVSLLQPLVALLERDESANRPLVISAFTSTGLATARKLYPRHRVIQFPFDLSWVVRRALRRFAPHLVIIGASELWPNFIRCARRAGAAVAVVNGKMSAKSYRVHARTRLIPRVLADLDLLAVQTAEHAQRLRSLGVPEERIRVTGNMKYDLTRAPADVAEGVELRRALGYRQDDIVIIGGSLHEREDEALLDAYGAARAVSEHAALIMVPRYPAEAAAMEQHARARGYRTVRKTALAAGTELPAGSAGVLIVDTVGELGKLYATADIAFVGGSLFYRGANKGGHNLMEPAILSLPVLFGPYNFSFKETVEDLLAANAGRLVADATELAACIAELVADGRARRELGLRAQRVVRASQGATARNYELLRALARAPARPLRPPPSDRKMPRLPKDLDSTL